MMQTQELLSRFPQLSAKVYGKPLVYLDNAATSLRPLSVTRKWDQMSLEYNSNLHRAVHRTAELATAEFEEARTEVARFIGASSPGQIVFTSGATAAINLVAYSFGELCVGEGDEIIVAESEHHSDIVPWQMLCRRKGAVIKVLPVDENGRLEIEALPSLITTRTRIVCVAQVSNVLGIVNPVREIAAICHSRNCALLVDGAQGIVHLDVNVSDMGCDFYVFSGHKMYAAPGTGVLYASGDWLDRMPPYMGGGEMIGTVKWEGSTYAPAPHKFEAGTQNISGVPAFKPAIDELFRLKEYDAVLSSIRDMLLEDLPRIEGLRLYGVPAAAGDKIPLFSISVEGVHHEDLALILDKMGIAVRSGQMCAEPLMDRYGVTGMLRASFAPYNTVQEAEYFLVSLRKAIEMLR
ncbi:MAG: aminotransferase class V-fold PLP-dependent enzyme [Bacteroidales bacterium]|nr:aminotransferase class V-fold PLP-dependent enzyme [Bacteroidales bacterium]